MILVDTSVLVYAVGSDHPLREPCRAIVAAIGEGKLAATTTVEVLQEFAHVRARRRGRSDAVTITERYATLLAPLVTVDAQDLGNGLRLFREYEGLGAFDAVLAAVAVQRPHIRMLVSGDRAFSGIASLAHVDPASAGFAERLGI